MSDEPKGQILPGSRFGNLLTELATKAETILELGTWHGLGSTKCLANGLVRPTQRMWTVEPDPKVCAEAASYYTDPRITFYNGTGLSFAYQPAFLSLRPLCLDLILFDGDDLATDTEFDLYSPLAKVVCLDDTKERKNRRQRATILANPDKWLVIADEPGDRLGWMVAQHKS